MTSVKRTGKPIALLLLISAAICFGCGGGGSGGTGVTAGGGIGGTGISAGVITAKGSVTVNGVTYGTDAAIFTVDDNSEASLADLAVGMRAIVQYTTRDNEALSVVYDPELKGPVEAVNLSSSTITVLGQTVLVNGATVLDGFSGIGELEAGDNGDIVEVSGFIKTAGDIQAVYVELEDASLTDFEIKGTVVNHDPDGSIFNLNREDGLQVDYDGAELSGEITEGAFVEVKGSLSEGIFLATRVEIEEASISVQDGEEVEIEGLVTALNPAPDVDFAVSGFPVRLTAGTNFENGTAGDIDVDVRLEVEGYVQGGVLIAEEVEFK